MKWILRFIPIFIAVIFIFAGYVFFVWQKFLNTPLLSSQANPIALQVSPGDTVIHIGYWLEKNTHSKHPQLWVWLVSHDHALGKIQAGEYLITSQMKVRDLLNNMTHGVVVVHHVTLIEGWTFAQFKQSLLDSPELDSSIAHLSNGDIMKKLGFPGATPEGLFFPDTYNYLWRQNDLTILEKAFQRMHTIVLQEWSARASNLNYKNPYEALIVASMIEKETATSSERPIIVGVILRRLEKHMRLQIDPTVVYGLNMPYGTPLTREDLKMDTPYNTYLHLGLPPTPICMPSLASIHAALHPEDDGYLYYVAKGDGTHAFSKTYPEQIRAVNTYIKSRVPRAKAARIHD